MIEKMYLRILIPLIREDMRIKTKIIHSLLMLLFNYIFERDRFFQLIFDNRTKIFKI